jgi:polysaccharide pyruvyl transferase WcaK-like protein
LLNHLYYLSLLVLAKFCGCSTEVVAIGVDPSRHPLNRLLTRWTLNHWADKISVRDEPSLKALESCGVTAPVTLATDPVFLLKPEEPGEKLDCIAFALAPSRVRSATDFAKALKIIHEATQLPIDLLVLFPEQDAALAREVAKKSSVTDRVRIVREPAQLLSWIPAYKLVVGSRYHALVIAAAAGVPFIGLGPQEKVKSLCTSKNSPYTNTDVDFNPDYLLHQILDVMASNHQFQSPVKSSILST